MNHSKLITRSILTGCLTVSLLTAGPARAAEPAPRANLKLLAEGFTAPIALTSLPDGSGRLLVADQAGYVYLLKRNGERLKEPFLDLHSRMVVLNDGMDERGLTGLALHPQFKTNHKLYLAYNAPLRKSGPQDWNNTMRVSEFRVTEKDQGIALSDSERVILEIDKPDWSHNSGRIAFGPDGYLYLTCGDGGAPNDVGTRGHAPEGNGQNLNTLLGKILRIDVNQGTPYAIPSDNPYADGKKGRAEIYAYGLRNPWGLSFDPGGSHDLIVTDVGQERWEEINIIVNGGNYGWRVREGFEGFDPSHPKTPPADAPKAGADGKPFIDPVLVYRTYRGNASGPQSHGISITGGYFYHGRALPHLAGKYVFGDWSRSMAIGDGILLAATRPQPHGATEKWTAEPLPLTDHPDGRIKAFVWSLGEDDEGEIYVLTNGANLVSGTRGKVFKLVATN